MEYSNNFSNFKDHQPYLQDSLYFSWDITTTGCL